MPNLFPSKPLIAVWFLFAMSLAGLDQATKYAIETLMPLRTSIEISSFFDLVHVLPPGAVLSFLANASAWQHYLFIVLGAAVSSLLMFELWRGMRSRCETAAYVCVLSGLLLSTAAKSDVLDQTVYLRTEGDLIQAVSVTLQHAVATSEQYRGSEPLLQRFARKEINARRKPIEQLNKLARIQPKPVKQLAIVPKDDASYRQAILRNHARLIELIEYGGGLPLSPTTKRLMDSLSRDAASELSLLSKLEKS